MRSHRADHRASSTSCSSALKNWDRWGAGDERGALNHQTDAHRAAAAALVADGAVVSLAHDLPLQPSAETPFPAHHHMLTAGDARDDSGIPGYEACGDYVGTQVHGLGITHVDALSHMFVKGEMFGGRPPSDVRSDGRTTNTVMTLADGLVGSGRAARRAARRAASSSSTVTSRSAWPTSRRPRRDAGRDGRRRRLPARVDRARRPPRRGRRPARPDRRRPGRAPPRVPAVAPRAGHLGARLRRHLATACRSAPTPGWPFPVHQIGIVAIGLHLLDNLAPRRRRRGLRASGGGGRSCSRSTRCASPVAPAAR